MGDRLVQRGGDNSTLYQASVAHYGISYADAKEIALDVFQKNFLQLSEEAAEVAARRAEAATEAFFKQLQSKYPEAIAAAREPGFQRALFSVQLNAACSEDGAMDGLLVEVLVERANEIGKSLRRIVLDEALLTIPKITTAQMETLSLCFYLKQVAHSGFSHSHDSALEALHQMLRICVAPFQDAAISLKELRHLQYAGCISISAGSSTVGETYARTYPGLFCNPINPHSVKDVLRPAFIPHPEHRASLRIPVVKREDLDPYLEGKGMIEHRSDIESILSANSMPHNLVLDKLCEAGGAVETVLRKWEADPRNMSYVELTSVGTAIGHANLVRATAFSTPLEVWIP
ncbi:LPO_1073/Vpar_1526 family protein [Micromonospora chalcea]|uniref:LPO_1073/Vpar_1526 family protein n=1 Tax=Micromonospora chalcea TaxID=1874 RepID=UPI0038F60F98